MAGAETDFETVDFEIDVPLDVYLGECPPTASTRGTFFQYVAKLAGRSDGSVDERVFEGVSSRRWVPFKTYPLIDFMRLCHNTARVVYPGLRHGQALRRVGWV